LLLAAVGTAARHAGQVQLYLAPLHAKTAAIKTLVANVRAAVRLAKSIAEQFGQRTSWGALLRHISDMIRHANLPGTAPTPHLGTG
jgi:hypothetical protein